MITQRWLRALEVGEEPDPRFSLANERTLLAWVRTALGLAAAGLATYAFAGDDVPPNLVEPAAVALLVAAALVSLAALQRFVAVQLALRQQRPLPLPWLAVPVVGLVLAAAATGVLVVLR